MIIRKTLREQVVEILRHKILSGEIKPGERIIEAKVAEELKVSRGPLREALRQIEEEGLVVYEAQKGCVVKTMTYEEMQETYLIQSTLEKLAVQMCGGEISKEQDEEMQKQLHPLQQQMHGCLMELSRTSQKLFTIRERNRKKSVYMPLMKIHWKSKLSTRHLTSWNWFPHQLIR